MPFQHRRGWGPVLVRIFGFIRKEVEIDEHLDMLFVSGLGNEDKMFVKKKLFCLLDSLLQEPWGNRTVINIEEGHVVEGHLVEQDDELHEVGVGLLPEGFLAFAEEVIQ